MDPNQYNQFQTITDTEHQIPSHAGGGSTLSKIIIPLAIIVAGGLIAWAIYASPVKTADQAKDSVQGVVAGALQQGAAPEAKYVAINETDHIRGQKDAKVVLIEYSDLECPFCKSYHETLLKLVEEFGKDNKFAWVYRHFPLDRHPKAPKESEATECVAFLAGENIFWKYVDLIYKETQSNDSLEPIKLYEFAKTVGVDSKQFASCLDSGKMKEKVATSYKEALEAGARGTPFTVLYYKGEYIPLIDDQGRSLGGLPYNIMNKIITDLLSK